MQTLLLLYYAILIARATIHALYDRRMEENSSFIGGNLLSTAALITVSSAYFGEVPGNVAFSAGVLAILCSSWEIRGLIYRWEAWRDACKEDPDSAEDSFEGIQVAISALTIAPAIYFGLSLFFFWIKHELA